MTGETGANGAGIAARPQLGATFVASGTIADMTLTANTWTQKAGEVEMIVGSIIEDVTGCVPPTGAGPQLFIDYVVDGNEVVYQTIVGTYSSTTAIALPPYYASQATGTSNAYFPSQALPVLMDPASDTAHTLVVRARDNCTTAAHISVTSLKLRVLRFL